MAINMNHGSQRPTENPHRNKFTSQKLFNRYTLKKSEKIFFD